MGRRFLAVVMVVGATSGGVAALAPAAASAQGVTVPPVCVKQPLPNPFIPGLQLQVGYCPS